MKVDISLSELKGMWRKTKGYSVDIEVQFSEEETAIIKDKKLGNKVICDWTGIGAIAGTSFELTIDLLLRGSYTNLFADRVSAQAFADNLEERMKGLKALLEGGAG